MIEYPTTAYAKFSYDEALVKRSVLTAEATIATELAPHADAFISWMNVTLWTAEYPNKDKYAYFIQSPFGE